MSTNSQFKKKFGFMASADGTEYVTHIETKGATFVDLSILLSCIHLIEDAIIEQLESTENMTISKKDGE